MQKHFFIILLSACVVAQLNAQQQMGTFMAYGPEAKYFSNLNFRVYQSKNGYLWIGTQNGLVRFDGKRYKNYFSNHADPNSPSDNSIVDIIEDKNGELWFCGFFRGVTRYNQQTGKFKKYPRLSADNSSYYGIHAGLKDNEGNLWFCTAGRGLAMYVYEKDSFLLYYPEPGKSKNGTIREDNNVTDVCEDHSDKNMLWVTTFKGLYSFDKQTKLFTHFPSGIKSVYSVDILAVSAESDTKGNLWIGTWGEGIFCFDPKTKKYIHERRQRTPSVGNDIKQVDDSLVYIAALNEGLFQLNLKNNRLQNITPPRSPVDITALKNDIQKVSVTPDAGLFAGGNYYVYQQHPAFTRMKKNISFAGIENEKETIELNDGVWDDKRQLYWLATYDGGGIYRLHKDELKAAPANIQPALPAGNFDFDMIITDALNRVWARNLYYGIYQWNDSLKSFTKAIDKIPLADSLVNSVNIMETDAGKNIWMISRNNFIFWDVKSNLIEMIPFEWGKEYTGNRSILYGELKFDPGGNAWLVCDKGLFQCIRDKKKVIHIYKTGTGKDDLSSSELLAGIFNKYNNFWIAGNQTGIQVYDWKNYQVISNHNMSGGLPSMTVSGIQSDSSGRIWVSTVAGLAMFDPEGKKIWQLFNRFDGMERDYLDRPGFITSNNKIIIDQVNGALLKDINEVIPSGRPPLIHITSITINNEEKTDSLLPEYIRQLKLPYSENNISIEFAAMDWLYPFRTHYRYKVKGLKGFETFIPNPEGKIDLVDLQPGTYELHIKALNSRGEWSDEVVLPITIKPPFWKTGWFIALCILATGALLYAVYRYRINQLKKLQEMRNNISRNLHDDIGASLSNIRILNELAKRNTGDPLKANEYLDTAGEDIQRISESLSDIVWNINPKYDEPENLFIRMKRYAADMMDGKNISCTFNFPEQDHGIKLNMDKRRDFYLIFKEAVNNLVKYSGSKTASVKVEIQKHGLAMTVSDEGRGFDTTTIQHGNGLHNMQHRATKWKAVLEIDSLPGKGTAVYLFMPV